MIRLTKQTKENVKALLFANDSNSRELAKGMLSKGQLLRLYKERLSDIISEGTHTELMSDAVTSLSRGVKSWHIKFPNFEPLERLWITITLSMRYANNTPNITIGMSVSGRLYENELVVFHRGGNTTRIRIERIYESNDPIIEDLRNAYVKAIKERFACWKKLHYNNI